MIQYPAAVDGTLTRVLEAGTGERHMLLVHGVGARADRWRRNIDALADAGYHVYAIDLPGHGLAQKGPDYAYSVPSFAAYTRGFLDSLGIEQVHLIGTSLGGHVTATVACSIPERVIGLVMVGTVGVTPLGPERRGNTRNRLTDTSLAGIKNKLNVVVHDSSLATDDWLQEEYRINNSPGAAEAFERIAAYFGDHLDDDVVGEELAALGDRFPSLFVWGREDLGIPLEIGEAGMAAVPGSRLAVMDDCAHAPYYERADTFNKIVLDFFTGSLGDQDIDGVELR